MVPVMDDLLPGMLDLARNSGETLTRQLTDQLRDLISGGRLLPGQRLPSTRALAAERFDARPASPLSQLFVSRAAVA